MHLLGSPQASGSTRPPVILMWARVGAPVPEGLMVQFRAG